MGIRIKNLHNYVISLKHAGTLSATTNKDVAVVPFAGKISNIYAYCAAGSAAYPIADIHLNGTTIFGASTKITVATGTNLASYSALSAQPTNLAAGDVLTLDIDTAGTGATNLVVQVAVTRTGMGAETNVADLDTIM